MTSPEHTFFVNCKFCQSFISTGKAKDLDWDCKGSYKFTCNECNYRSESLLYTEPDKKFVDLNSYYTEKST